MSEYTVITNSTIRDIGNKQTKETAMTEEEIKTLARMVSDNIMQDHIFVSNLLYDLTSRIDYAHITSELSHKFTTNEVAAQLLNMDEVSGRRFATRIVDADKFRSVLNFMTTECVSNHIRGREMQDQIEDVIERKSINMANDTVDRTLKLISQRIKEASDV